MRIYEIDTSRRREANRFIKFPFRLYRGCEQWVPPIMPDARFQLNRKKNAFYRRNDAAFLLAERDGEVVGRIVVMEPRYYNEFKGTNNAHFYLFDVVEDQAVADALLDAAADWARARGLTHFRGPLGFRPFDGFGMLARGFEYRPAVGIPYNYAYYPRLVENWGFELEERVYSGYVNVHKLVREFPQRVLDIAEKVKERYGFEVKTYPDKRTLVREVAPPLVDLYNRTLTHIAGDPPVSEDEIEELAKSIAMIADPRLLKFIMKDGELAGFMFAFPDISRGLQRSGGRLYGPGLLHVLWDMRTTTWLNFNGMGILPEYQGRGGTAIMYAELYRTMADFPQYEHGDVVQISEFNAQSLNEMKKFGVDFNKTHHIYKRDI